MRLLEVNNLHAGYGSREVLSGLSFAVNSHELVGILGANGSGKTTLLKAICGILPVSGQRMLLGRPIEKLSAGQLARISRYIPQRSGIAIDISVLDVVLMGFNPRLKLLEYPNASMRRDAMAALEQVGLKELAQRNYQTLSEGQKQMCILARTMLLEAGVLFLDEPESALDFGGRYRMLELVRSWLLGGDRGAVVTLHDPQLALCCCDRLLLLAEGKLAGQICPGEDSLEEMEEKLAMLYGPLSVLRCSDRSGTARLVLLKEAAEWKH